MPNFFSNRMPFRFWSTSQIVDRDVWFSWLRIKTLMSEQQQKKFRNLRRNTLYYMCIYSLCKNKCTTEKGSNWKQTANAQTLKAHIQFEIHFNLDSIVCVRVRGRVIVSPFDTIHSYQLLSTFSVDWVS